MSNLSFFLSENVEKLDNTEIVVSKRFKDAKGEPIKWIFKPVSAEETNSIKKNCMTRVPVPGKKNQFSHY